MPSIDFEAMNEGILDGISKSYFNSFMNTFEEQLAENIVRSHITTVKPSSGKVGVLLADYAKANKRALVSRRLECLVDGDNNPLTCLFMYTSNAIWMPAIGPFNDNSKNVEFIIYRLEESTSNNKRILKLNKVDSVKIAISNESAYANISEYTYLNEKQSDNLLDW